MPIKSFIASSLIGSALLFAHASYADVPFTTTISGYGTIGGTYTDNGQLNYVLDPSQFASTASRTDIGLDSKFAVQANLLFSDQLSIIIQEEAKRRGADNFAAGTQWAFVQYKPTPNLQLRLGRFALQTFLESDTRDVGYAQPWFHAPNEIYADEPFETLDGFEALWHTDLGPVGVELDGSAGATQQPLLSAGISIPLNTKSAFNFAATATYGDFLLRVTDTTVVFPFTVALSPSQSETYNDMDHEVAVSFQYDNGDAIVISEWAWDRENNAPGLNTPLLNSIQGYLAAGYRFGKWTPMAIYSGVLYGNCLINPPGSFRTPSLSLRYDLMSNVALKAEWTRAQANNPQIWATSSTTSTARVNIVGVGVDFVF